jgi:ATP-binding cassette subfamily B protein
LRAELYKDKSNKDSSYNQKALDSLLNFETVKYFNAEDFEQARFYKSLVLYKDSQVKLIGSRKYMGIGQSLIIISGMALCLLVAYRRILRGDLSVGDFVVFQMYLNQMINPLQKLSSLWK